MPSQTGTIHKLDPDIIRLIAAGEVIERPASVVKELIENSIDAGAGHIEIKLVNGGLTAISVSDDGYGIPSGEVPLLLNRHTTSKIQSEEDLNSIQSLGFRGEALYSIAAVSTLILSTRYRDEDAGTRLTWENGGKKIEPISWHGGTQVEALGIFHATPARRKFLRSSSAEYARVATLVSAYALSYPSISWKLSHNGRETLFSPGTGNIDDSLVAVYGADFARKMVRLKPLGGSVKVEGAVSSLELTRARRTDQLFFMNGRFIKDASIAASLERAYFPFLQDGRHPVAILNISCDPSEVDVNVHPHKKEVRFAQPGLITSAVNRTVKHSLQADNLIENSEKTVEINPETGEVTVFPQLSEPLPFMPDSRGRPDDLTWAINREKSRHSGEWEGIRTEYPVKPREQHLQHEYSSFDELGIADDLDIAENTLQFADTYLIYNRGKSVFIIDQHNLHERILYEEFSASELSTSGTSQALLFPLQVTLPPALAGIVNEHMHDLAALGFEIEEFSGNAGSSGGQSFVLRAVPLALKSSDPVQALSDCLERAGMDEKIDEPGGFRNAFAINLACKTAIKAGRKLTMDEIEFLIKHIEDGTFYTCPHGRPTVIRLDEEWFRKVFRRS